MELIWGVAIGSLALIADALHMFTDLMALVRNSRLPVLTGVFQMTPISDQILLPLPDSCWVSTPLELASAPTLTSPRSGGLEWRWLAA